MLLYGFIKTRKSLIAYHLLLGSQLPTFRSYELFSALPVRIKSDFITQGFESKCKYKTGKADTNKGTISCEGNSSSCNRSSKS